MTDALPPIRIFLSPGQPSSKTRLVAAIVVGSLVVLASAIARVLVWPPSDVPESVDAIVVLGGGDQVRLLTGLALYADGVADALVLSAGTADDAADHGVHCEDTGVFCVEPEPGTTAGEARTVAALAAEQGWSSLAVVTSTYHLSRARMLFGQCFDGHLFMVEAPVPRATMTFLGDVVRELPDMVAGATFARAC